MVDLELPAVAANQGTNLSFGGTIAVDVSSNSLDIAPVLLNGSSLSITVP